MTHVNFQMYSPTGLLQEFRVTGDTPVEFIKNMEETLDLLENRGFSADRPDPSLAPRLEHIIGYVWGEANTNIKGITQPCVYLYNFIEAFTYKVVTVYAERLGELPLDTLSVPLVWNGEPGAAPSRQTAKTKKFMNSCDFTILLMPRVDFKTKKAITKANSQTGEQVIQYKFLRVLKVNRYPYRTFKGLEDVIEWSMTTKLFTSSTAVATAYQEVKDRVKPDTATAMFKAWIDYINQLIVNQDE